MLAMHKNIHPEFTLEELRQKIEDNSLDLSLCQIRKVPVNIMGSLRKATQVDLSCNSIIRLPDNFCTSLHWLVRLDLSKNKLVELPSNIGLLQNLKHLDLYQNQLSRIPLGFSQLNKLMWLDLKDNPLDPSYNKIVGDCLDDKQCRQCAKRIVTAMKSAIALEEKKRQQQIAEEAKRKAALEEEERKLLEIKKQKQKKRQKKKAKREKNKEIEPVEYIPYEEEALEIETKQPSFLEGLVSKSKKFFRFLLLSSAVLGFAYFGWLVYFHPQKINETYLLLNPYLKKAENATYVGLAVAKDLSLKGLSHLERLTLAMRVYFMNGVEQLRDYYEGW